MWERGRGERQKGTWARERMRMSGLNERETE